MPKANTRLHQTRAYSQQSNLDLDTVGHWRI